MPAAISDLYVLSDRRIRRPFPWLMAVFVCLLMGSSPRFVQAQSYPELLSDPEFVPAAQAAIDSLYNLRFEAAQSLLNPWKEQYPEHPFWLFWRGMELWWQVVPDLENTAFDKELFYTFSKANYDSGKLLRNAPGNLDLLLIQSASNAYIARQYSNRHQWLNAVQHGKAAVETLFLIEKIDSTLSDIKFGLGMYEYYTDYLPERYPVLDRVSWLWPDGDRKKGLEMITEAAKSAVFLRPESEYFLGNIYLNYEKKPEVAMKSIRMLSGRYPRNPFYAMLLLKTTNELSGSRRTIQMADSLSALPHIQNSKYRYAFEERASVIRGRKFMRIGDLQSAEAQFENAIQIAERAPEGKRRKRYAVSAYQLGRIAIKNDDKKTAKSYLKAAIKYTDDADLKTSARKLLKSLK